MRYLVDTNVISAGAPSKIGQGEVADWLDANSGMLLLSAVTVFEIENGIARLRREGATRKAAALTAWFDTLLHLYAHRIFPLDVSIARLAGNLSDRARGNGFAPGFADVAIAATARHHRLTILTRNLRDFQPLGVAACDPFVELPDGPPD
ncbi:MAG: type II toxin-antitoxin system VapC family toxin, partial [Rhizomicrobium sp.]